MYDSKVIINKIKIDGTNHEPFCEFDGMQFSAHIINNCLLIAPEFLGDHSGATPMLFDLQTKKKTDLDFGFEEKVYSSVPVAQFKVHDNKIYFAYSKGGYDDEYPNELYCCYADGKNAKLIVKDDVFSYDISGDKTVYMTNSGDVYLCDLDGKNAKKLFKDERTHNIYYVNNKIYYRHLYNSTLYQYDEQGNKSAVPEAAGDDTPFILDGETAYLFTNSSDNSKFKFLNLITGEQIFFPAFDAPIYHFSIVNNWIFFTVIEDSGLDNTYSIYRIKKGGEKSTKCPKPTHSTAL